ncbi:MAG: peptidylprolyl isomerase [Terricaulis sp.]|nr:peptidylprolyl isomerase [Terricaulis sp.]
MRAALLAGLWVLAACASAPPAEGQTAPRSMDEIINAAPASDWRDIAPENMLFMRLANGGTVIIELAPSFAPNHVANVQALARAHFWDGTPIARSQENYVVQWNGPDEGQPASRGAAQERLEAEFARPAAGLSITRLQDPDSYAPVTGFADGFPVAGNGERAWLAHCYGMVGAGRGDTTDSGSGAELYVVIGHAPRHLDRNVTLLGRVLQGMEHLSVMPRGTGPLGFYEEGAARPMISRIELGSELPTAERPRLQALRTESESFRDVVESRRTRREEWFVEPTGRINVCNAPLPIRVAPQG